MSNHLTPLALLTKARAEGKRLTIGLPNGRDCSLGVYVQAWRKLRELSPETECPGWGHFPEEAGEILRTMSAGVHDRINRHMTPPLDTCDDDTFWRLRRLANMLNGTRVVVGLCEIPEGYRARLAHRVKEAA